MRWLWFKIRWWNWFLFDGWNIQWHSYGMDQDSRDILFLRWLEREPRR